MQMQMQKTMIDDDDDDDDDVFEESWGQQGAHNRSEALRSKRCHTPVRSSNALEIQVCLYAQSRGGLRSVHTAAREAAGLQTHQLQDVADQRICEERDGLRKAGFMNFVEW